MRGTSREEVVVADGTVATREEVHRRHRRKPEERVRRFRVRLDEADDAAERREVLADGRLDADAGEHGTLSGDDGTIDAIHLEDAAEVRAEANGRNRERHGQENRRDRASRRPDAPPRPRETGA